MLAWAREIKDTTLLRWHQVHRFEPKIRIYSELGPYLIKTAENMTELTDLFRLRHEVFYQEFQGQTKAGLDVDRFDSEFDHLIIIHRETEQIIGTYRLSCSEYSDESYAALEFNLQNIFRLKGPHLELGRACIHKDHRRGGVISLLWRGIAEYMNKSGVNVLFGCSSVKINEARSAALIYQSFFEQGLVISPDFATTTKNFRMKDLDAWVGYFKRGLTEAQKVEAWSLVPPLLTSYLKLGARIGGLPAFDQDFDCLDFITVLEKCDLDDSLARRFQIVR